MIITITNSIEFGEVSGTLEISDNSFNCFLVALFTVLHKPINHTNSKVNVSSNMININKTVDQFSIKSSIDCGCLTGFGKLDSMLKRSSTMVLLEDPKNNAKYQYLSCQRSKQVASSI